jgi:hypothetical protein
MVCACKDAADKLDKERQDWIDVQSWPGWSRNFVTAALYEFWHNYEAELTYWMDQWMSVTLESSKFRITLPADRIEDAIFKILLYLEENPELQT